MYKFTKLRDVNNEYDKVDYEMKIDSIHLGDLIENFEDFLRGCGYQLDGRLEVVEEDSTSDSC